MANPLRDNLSADERRTVARARTCAIASAAVGGLSMGTIALVAYLQFGAGIEQSGWLLPLSVAGAAGAMAALLIFLTAWAFAWSVKGGLGPAVGRPLAWTAILLGGLLPGVFVLIAGALFLLNFLGSAGQ